MLITLYQPVSNKLQILHYRLKKIYHRSQKNNLCRFNKFKIILKIIINSKIKIFKKLNKTSMYKFWKLKKSSMKTSNPFKTSLIKRIWKLIICFNRIQKKTPSNKIYKKMISINKYSNLRTKFKFRNSNLFSKLKKD